MTTLPQEINKQSSGNGYIELWTVDTTPIGGADIFHFTTQVTENNTPVVYQTITYEPFPVEVTGIERNGTSAAPPQPTLTVSNVGGLLMSTLLQNKDMVGSKVSCIRTFRNFLDDGVDADPNAHFQPIVYYIEQKSLHNKQTLQFILRSPLDRNRQLPRRQVLRDAGWPGAGLFNGQFG